MLLPVRLPLQPAAPRWWRRPRARRAIRVLGLADHPQHTVVKQVGVGGGQQVLGLGWPGGPGARLWRDGPSRRWRPVEGSGRGWSRGSREGSGVEELQGLRDRWAEVEEGRDREV